MSNDLAVYMGKPEVVSKFVSAVGSEKQARPYIQSVMIAVNSSADLMKCTNESIFNAALRAASLGLSCDPALKQAWIIPYNKNIGTRDNPKWIKEAQFQPHYKGLYTLAMRTNKYWNINVSPVYEGQRVLENSLTGLHVVREPSGLTGLPDAANPAYTDVTVRRRADQKIIGWIGYFKTKKGFEKSVYMSVRDIDDHAKKYVKDYGKNPNWNDAEKRQVMEMKTVLRELLSWADKSGTEDQALEQALAYDESVIDVQAEEVSEPTLEPVETAAEPAQEPQQEVLPVIEYMNPFGDYAVKVAMQEWNIDQKQAIAELRKLFGNSAKPMTADEIKSSIQEGKKK